HGAHLAMLGGAAVATRVRDDRAASTVLLLVAACGLQVALFGVWFEFGERHREFATPFLLLLVCLGLARAQSWWLARLASRSSTRSIDHRPLPTIKR
ncbi:hypothetical protein L3X40_21675, partial [Rhizorhapis sp. SPR117]|nr:hypothetical protein [Rhizorhapis sp. SPR117]